MSSWKALFADPLKKKKRGQLDEILCRVAEILIAQYLTCFAVDMSSTCHQLYLCQ